MESLVFHVILAPIGMDLAVSPVRAGKFGIVF